MVYVTTFNNQGEGANGTFIRLNHSMAGAIAAAEQDVKESLQEEYSMVNGTHVLDTVEAETDDSITVVRIINPHNGHEYECYEIAEYPVED